MDGSDLSVRDKLDAIEACERLIQYYEESIEEVNRRPINMGSDLYELEMTDEERYNIDDRVSYTKKIESLKASRKRLLAALEDDYTFRIATGSIQQRFDRIK